VKKIRISAVSYTNTKPFLYGLQHAIIDQIDLSLDIPSDCAQKLIDDKVDIGLIPVAATIKPAALGNCIGLLYWCCWRR
jgi:chorismate dehydratase